MWTKCRSSLQRALSNPLRKSLLTCKMANRVQFSESTESIPRSRSSSTASTALLSDSATRYSIDYDERTVIKAEERLRKLHGVNRAGHHGPFKRESLNFKIMDNGPLRQWYIRSTKWGNAQRLTAKWLIYLIIGITVGMAAWALRAIIEPLYQFKLEKTNEYLKRGEILTAFFVYWGINAAYVTISAVAVILGGPLAGGSGIPEVKGYLNGVRIPGLVNLKTFVGKFISIVFSFASCLALGPEGPMIHIGSALGAGLSAAKSKTLRIRLPKIFERLRSDREQRDFISSGAAAGVAAAFGAPVGGVLFAIEETSSFWSRELTWRTLFGCTVAALMVNMVLLIRGGTIVAGSGLVSFGISRNALFRSQEFLAFALLGVLGGILGAAFVHLNSAINRFRRDHLSNMPHW
ncbi:hypothetical protein PROFUN_15787, partial [Planoprotostelium fungivorum]